MNEGRIVLKEAYNQILNEINMKKEDLIKEAIRRGYVEGAIVYNLYYTIPKQTTLPRFKSWDFHEGYEGLWYDSDGDSILIYEKKTGWAEIISSPKGPKNEEPMTLEQLEKQKAEIEKKIEELKLPKIEFGKWYYAEYYSNQKWLIKFSKSKENDKKGIYVSNEYVSLSSNRIKYVKNDIDFFSILKEDSCDLIRLATNEEIKNVLINEAIIRGFKPGVKYKTIHNAINTAKGEFGFGWMGRENLFFQNSDGLIYENGKWGEIIKEEKLKIGEYEVEWVDDTLHIGCKRININTVKELKTLMSNLDMTEITLLGETVTKYTIEKILKLKHK